jgi:secreted frizzled-related protein 1
MHLPNLLNHESITEILYELPLWQSLLSLGCHSNARLLLCSILAPVCLQQTPEKSPSLVSFDNNQDSISTMTHKNKKFLYPCRTLCESVKQSCEPRMISQFGYKWPTMSKRSKH